MLSCLAHDFDRQPRRNTAAPSSAPAPPPCPAPSCLAAACPPWHFPFLLPCRVPYRTPLARLVTTTPSPRPRCQLPSPSPRSPPSPPHHGPLIRPAAPADGAILQRALRPTRQSALRLSGHQWLKWHKMGNLVPIDIRDTGTGTIGPARFPLRVALFPPEGLLNQSSRLRPASCRSGEPDRSSPCQAAPAGALTAGGSTAPPARTTARPAAPALPAPARTRSRDP